MAECETCGGDADCTIPDLALGPRYYCEGCCPRCNMICDL